jgi:hypothetical protein
MLWIELPCPTALVRPAGPGVEMFRRAHRDNQGNKARFRAGFALNRALFHYGRQPLYVIGLR